MKYIPDHLSATAGDLSLSKKYILPAKRAFEINFLTQLCRVKKYFYPHKCAVCRHSRQTVRAGRMFGGKVTLVTFSTVSTAGFTAAVLCRKKLSWTGGKDSPVPVFPVKAAEAYRLGDVRFLDILAAGEVGAGERYLENPVVGTSGKSQLVEGGLQQ